MRRSALPRALAIATVVVVAVLVSACKREAPAAERPATDGVRHVGEECTGMGGPAQRRHADAGAADVQ